MKTTTKICSAILLSTLLPACASLDKMDMNSLSLAPAPTEQSDDLIVKRLTGQPVGFVENTLGLPNRRKELSTGAAVWTYIDHKKGANENTCEVSLSIRDGIVQRVSIATSSKSLFSAVSDSCTRIRNTLS